MTVLHSFHEKRSKRRLPAANLTAQLKRKQGLFSSQLDLTVVDFNLFGMALMLLSEPELGAKITFKLVFEMDMGNITVNGVEANIVNKVFDLQSGQWRVGLIFSSQTKQSTEMLGQLKRIKQLLEKSAAIKERISQKTG